MKPYNPQLEPEVEDIFDQGGPAPVTPTPPAPQPRPMPQPQPQPQPVETPPEPEYEYRERFYQTTSGKIASVVIIILVLAIVTTILYKYTPVFDFLNQEEVAEEVNTNTPEVNLNTTPIEYPLIDNTSPEEDSDGDGLTDISETNEYKTDPNKIDTDSDGLTDREEVKVYLTDPLDADTDGDGYSDGVEVSRFFNPLGTGKLLNLNKAINELNE